MSVPAIDVQILDRDYMSPDHRKAPGEQQKGISSTAASNSESSEILLKCLHTSCGMGNKQEQFEMCTHLQGFDLTGITEVW